MSDCGCRIVETYPITWDISEHEIIYCPMHKAAERMLWLLEKMEYRIRLCHRNHGNEYLGGVEASRLLDEVRAIRAATEGKG